MDCYCPEIKLALEVDGSTHEDDEVYEHDKQKETFLAKKGIQLPRVTDEEVLLKKSILNYLLHNLLQ